jgi:type IV pilus assembly protein PilY1
MFRAYPGHTGSTSTSDGSYTSTTDVSYGRKFFYRPTVATVGGAPHIYLGTGDREHPLNMAVTDRMYCIIDWKAVNPAVVYPIDESALEDVTENLLQKFDTNTATIDAISRRLYSRPDLPYDNFGNFRSGWYIRLDGGDRKVGGDLGEKVLAPATVFNGQVFFTTYQPKVGAVAGCDAGNLGISRLYHLDYKTGEAVYNYDQTNDLNAVDGPINERAVGGPAGELLQRTDRVRTLGEGIPSGIVTLLDASGKVTVLISSSDKVEASGLPDVKLIMPVYWMQW